MFELTDQIYQAVLTLDDDYRQFFCLQKCQEQGSLYLLKEPGAEGMPLMLSDEPEEGDDETMSHTFLPIWCHPQFVTYYQEHAANQDVKNYELLELKLDLFRDKWAPSLAQNGIVLALMPLDADKNFTLCRATIFSEPDAAKTAAAEAQQSDQLTEADKAALKGQAK